MDINHVQAAPLSDNALQILQERYLLKDPSGHCMESPNEMFVRVANWVAKAEEKWGDKSLANKWAMEFYETMVGLKFLPNSPTLMNAGRKNAQLSACFVLPVEDRFPDIFSTIKLMSLIQLEGGGTGFNFSRLSPVGDKLKYKGGMASGPLAFMEIFNSASEHIKQVGRRPGANMGMLNVDHPDIEVFIDSKNDFTSPQNFNISLGITDEFMRAGTKRLEFNPSLFRENCEIG